MNRSTALLSKKKAITLNSDILGWVYVNFFYGKLVYVSFKVTQYAPQGGPESCLDEGRQEPWNLQNEIPMCLIQVVFGL